jgi:ABC-type antimicrobial peptide transport system permease subunit
VANLLLARCSTRQREFAVRTAIGAGRGRLIRQLLTESLLLAVAGSVVGTLICAWAIPAIASLPGVSLPRAEGASLNIWVLTFCVLASVLAAVGSGLAPALRAARVDPQRDLKEGGGSRPAQKRVGYC